MFTLFFLEIISRIVESRGGAYFDFGEITRLYFFMKRLSLFAKDFDLGFIVVHKGGNKTTTFT